MEGQSMSMTAGTVWKWAKPHVHFKDATSLNYDGMVHDKHKGIPKISNKVRKEWLERK
ncbi:MAG: hypothetical protein HDT30_08515 [Clostridiales bacterium]|nr:hypothetical protein [Clostridiales bacterium]